MGLGNQFFCALTLIVETSKEREKLGKLRENKTN